MDDYKIIVEQEHSTVMAHFDVMPKPAEGFQSEAKLEAAFIKQLQSQGYEYVKVKDEASLLVNLRRQMETLNDVVLSDSEWSRLLPMISNEQMTIQDKTEMLQGKGYILNLTMDNGLTKNIKLVDKTNVYNNRLQVINQYEVEGTYKNRYDVTILVNGLPMVHIELKRRGVDIKEAFNQINRYQRDSFWAGRAMFDFVQIFVISNGTETKYYSNTTRYAKEQESDSGQRKHKTDGNSFEFTSYWSDQENTLLTDLRDFTTTFFAKHTILNILTKYCVFNVDKQLLVMRPYQIAADSSNGKDIAAHTDSHLQQMAGNYPGRRLYLAYDRKRKDADLLQDSPVSIEDGEHQEGAVRGRQKGFGLSDDEGV